MFLKKYHKTQEAGFGIMIIVFFFLILFTTAVISVSSGLVSGIQDVRHYAYSRQAFYTADAGIEDALYRMNDSTLPYNSPEVLSIAGEQATTTMQTLSATEKQIISRSEFSDTMRNISVLGTIQAGTAFGSAVQSGQGGLILKNSSFVSGDVYSNGTVIGTNSNTVSGDVVSASSSGYIENVDIDGDVYANEIQNSEIGGDAYYDQTITNTIVTGTKYPGSADQPTAPFPISDETINEWKADAEAGGVITSCPYQIKKDTVTIGPVKIDCDLEVTNSSDVTLAGPVWVNGDIQFRNSSIVRADSSLGEESVALIADDISDPNSGGVIDISNSIEFYGSGTDGSYVLLVSQNASAENGGGTDAINLGNSSSGEVLLYAAHGKITFNNSVDARQVTAHTIELQNSSELLYEEGLSSVIFSGAQGRWGVGDWKEVE